MLTDHSIANVATDEIQARFPATSMGRLFPLTILCFFGGGELIGLLCNAPVRSSRTVLAISGA